jgi:transcriptional regulator with XRE-family HTH domain
MVEVAARSGVPVETLRKIEAGRIPTPAFFTVVALAGALGIPLDDLARVATDPASESGSGSGSVEVARTA